jgi:hypothetical protein
VPELLFVAGAERFAEGVEELDAALGEGHVDDTAIFGRAFAADESPVLKLVEHAGDVGRPGDEATGQFQCRQRGRVNVPQEPEEVVLLGREVELREELVFVGLEAIVGPPEAEEDLLFERIEPGRGASRSVGVRFDHAAMIFVSTSIVQTSVCP